MIPSNTITGTDTGFCQDPQCAVFINGVLAGAPDGTIWDRSITIQYLDHYGIWEFCGIGFIPAIVFGPPPYGGQTAPLFLRGHTYRFHTIARLLDSHGNVILTAYSQDVSVAFGT